MRELAIYFVKDNDDKMAFVCQGVLLDYLRARGYTVQKTFEKTLSRTITNPDGNAVAIYREILTCDDSSFIAMKKPTRITICKALNIDRTWGMCESESAPNMEIRTLDTTEYAPVSFPIHTYIQRDNKGRLYCRLNLHPELEGIRDNGKLYFPSRAWKDVAEGEAFITGCSSVKRYGFINGEVIKYIMPDEDKVLRWISKKISTHDKIIAIRNSVHGDYYGVYNLNTGEYCRVVCEADDKFSLTTYFPLVDDVSKLGTSIEWTSCGQLLLDRLFGKQAYTITTFLGRINICEFDRFRCAENRHLDCKWQSITQIRGCSDLMQRAIECNAIKIDQPVGYDFYILSVFPDNIINFWDFTAQEVDNLIDEINKINTEQSELIKSCLRRGKIRLHSAE